MVRYEAAVQLTYDELALLRVRLVDEKTNWAVDGALDSKLFNAQERIRNARKAEHKEVIVV